MSDEVEVGVRLAAEGEFAAAAVEFERALATGDPTVVGPAGHGLGRVLLELGDGAGAREALRVAADSADVEHALAASSLLALLLTREGDVAGARRLYERLAGSGEPGFAAHGAVGVASLLHESGDPRARAAFEELREAAGHEAYVAASLVELYADAGELAAAGAEFERLAGLGDMAQVGRAAAVLGHRLAENGDAAGARAAYEAAVEHGEDAEQVAAVQLNLGALLSEEEPELARQAYVKVLRAGFPGLAATAALNLGVLLVRYDPAAARESFRHAARLGHPDVAEVAARYGLSTVD